MLQPGPRRSCPGTPALLWQQPRKGKIKTQIRAWRQRNLSARLRRAQHQTRGLCCEGEEEHGSCDIGSALFCVVFFLLFFFIFPLNQPRVACRSDIQGYIPQVDVSKTHNPPGSCLPKPSSLRQRRKKKNTSLSATAQLGPPAAVCPGGELWLCPAASRNGAGSSRSDAGSSRSHAGSAAPGCKEAARVVPPASTPGSCWWGVGGF